MKVTFETEAAEIAMQGPNVERVFAALTPEQNERIVADVVREWLTNNLSTNHEREEFEKRVAESVLKENQGNGYGGVNTLAEARGHWKFRERVSGFKSTRDKILASVSAGLLAAAHATAGRVVAEHEGTHGLLKAAAEAVTTLVPGMLKDAATQAFMGLLRERLPDVNYPVAIRPDPPVTHTDLNAAVEQAVRAALARG